MGDGGWVDIEVVSVDGADVVYVSGELDVSTVPRLRVVVEPLVLQPERDLVVDLNGVRFADASVIGLLVTSTQRAMEEGGRLVVRNPSVLLRRMFDITRVDRVLHIDGDGTGAHP